jgi:hypothetical protein
MTFRPYRAGDTVGTGDRVKLPCPDHDDVPEGVIVGVTRQPSGIWAEVEFKTNEMTAHLAAHGEKYAALIASMDQGLAAEGNPLTVTLPMQLRDMLCCDDENRT